MFAPSEIGINNLPAVIPQFSLPTKSLNTFHGSNPTSTRGLSTNYMSSNSDLISPNKNYISNLLDGSSALPPVIPLQELFALPPRHPLPIFLKPANFPLPECLSRFNLKKVDDCIATGQRKLSIGMHSFV
jgi:hypothetical protein